MDIPCRLYRLGSGVISEHVPPGQSAVLLVGAGVSVPEPEARRLGIAEYFIRRDLRRLTQDAPETKAVHQEEVEDKAVSQDETEDKALIIPERIRGIRR